MRTLLGLTLVSLTATLWQPAQAQAPQSRERELLRRAQAALREVTAERDALRAAEAALKARLADAEAAVERARADATALSGPLRQAERASAQLEATLQAEREQAVKAQAEAQAALGAAAGREAKLSTDLAAVRAALDERTQANHSVSALLARTTAALRDAERRNADLHTLSLTLIDRWRHKTPAEALLQSETLVGVAGVRAEDQAEQWRQQADALSRPATAR